MDLSLDPRLKSVTMHAKPGRSAMLDAAAFTESIRPCVDVVYRALSGEMAVPDFKIFRDHCQSIMQGFVCLTGIVVIDELLTHTTI